MLGICTKIKSWVYKIFNGCILQLFKINYKQVDTVLHNVGNKVEYDFLKNVEYYDESNDEIRDLFNLKGIEVYKNKYKVYENRIHFNAQKKDGENWLLFLWKINQKEYIVEFDYLQSNVFWEMQIAFNYKNIKNRNRFLILNNELLWFDCIKNGVFYTPIIRRNFNYILKEKQKNHFRIVVSHKYYQIEVNGKVLLTIKVKKQISLGRDFAIILWENKNNRLINGSISNMKLVSCVIHI